MSSEKKEDICSRPDCNWVLVSKEVNTVVTSKEVNSYVCLRCGKKWPPPPPPVTGPGPNPNPLRTVFMALVAALVISLVLDSARSPRHPRFDRYDHPCSYGC